MIARVVTIRAPSAALAEASAHVRDHILPALRELAGFGGAFHLIERANGKSLTLVFWASEADLRASDRAFADRRPPTSGDPRLIRAATVSEYEVAVTFGGGPDVGAMFARAIRASAPQDRMAGAIRYVERAFDTMSREHAGFRGGYLLVDRRSSESLALSLWAGERDLLASASQSALLRVHGTRDLADEEVAPAEEYEVAIRVQSTPTSEPSRSWI
jgi:hypothetical protein